MDQDTARRPIEQTGSSSAPARPTVLLVAEAFGGGLFEITRHLAEGLVERGHRVTIAYGTRPETPSDPRQVIDPRVDLVRIPWTDRGFRAQIAGFRALRRLVDDVKPDVVHLMSSYAGMHGALAVGRRRPTVYTPQGYAFTMGSEPVFKRALFRALEYFVARRVTVVGACSQTEADQARRGLRAPRVEVVENGIAELDAPVVRSENVKRRRVVALGRPSPQRRPEACARILAAVSDLAEVAWIGGGPDSNGLTALEDAGIPVTGWLPHAQTQTLLGDADVYLHWTAWDGLALSILEALAGDVLVVGSDIGPNREVLGPDQVCDSETQAIALIRRVLLEPELRQRFLAEQRMRRSRFGATAMVERWADLYARLPAAA